MLSFLYTEINIFCIFLTSIMLVNVHQKRACKTTADQSLFQLLLLSNISVLTADTVMWLINGQTFVGAYTINNVSSVIYYILNPTACLIWLAYCCDKVGFSRKKATRFLIIFMIPFAINLFFIVMSPFTHWIFYVDPANVYHRGYLFWMMPLLCLAYFVCAFAMIFFKWKEQTATSGQRDIYLYLLIFPVIPFAGSIIQSLFYGVSLIWICTTLSIFLVFINLQNGQIGTDALTGLYNRRELMHYLSFKTRNSAQTAFTYAIIMDIDAFKLINDTYGHIEGDLALKNLANILRNSCHAKEDFIARLGGDEFIIIGQLSPKNSLGDVICHIENELIRFNNEHDFPYKLSISLGAVMLNECMPCTVDHIIQIADERMYAMKDQHKINCQ